MVQVTTETSKRMSCGRTFPGCTRTGADVAQEGSKRVRVAKERSQTKDSEQAIRGSPFFNLAVDSDCGPMVVEAQVVRKSKWTESR